MTTGIVFRHLSKTSHLIFAFSLLSLVSIAEATPICQAALSKHSPEPQFSDRNLEPANSFFLNPFLFSFAPKNPYQVELKNFLAAFARYKKTKPSPGPLIRAAEDLYTLALAKLRADGYQAQMIALPKTYFYRFDGRRGIEVLEGPPGTFAGNEIAETKLANPSVRYLIDYVENSGEEAAGSFYAPDDLIHLTDDFLLTDPSTYTPTLPHENIHAKIAGGLKALQASPYYGVLEANINFTSNQIPHYERRFGIDELWAWDYNMTHESNSLMRASYAKALATMADTVMSRIDEILFRISQKDFTDFSVTFKTENDRGIDGVVQANIVHHLQGNKDGSLYSLTVYLVGLPKRQSRDKRMQSLIEYLNQMRQVAIYHRQRALSSP